MQPKGINSLFIVQNKIRYSTQPVAIKHLLRRHLSDRTLVIDLKKCCSSRKLLSSFQSQFKRDHVTGFDTLQYELESKRSLTIDGAPVNVYNVELHCDKSVSPWCDHEKT